MGSEVLERVQAVLAKSQRIPEEKITADSTFEELGMDSLDGMNLMFAVEEEFKIDIPDSIAQNMKSVRQVVDSLTRVLEGKDISDLVAIAKGDTQPAAS